MGIQPAFNLGPPKGQGQKAGGMDARNDRDTAAAGGGQPMGSAFVCLVNGAQAEGPLPGRQG